MIWNICWQEVTGMCVSDTIHTRSPTRTTNKTYLWTAYNSNSPSFMAFHQGGTVWAKSPETEGGTKQSIIITTEGEINIKQIALLPQQICETSQDFYPCEAWQELTASLVGTRSPTRPVDSTVDAILLITHLRCNSQIVALDFAFICNGQRCFPQEFLPTH